MKASIPTLLPRRRIEFAPEREASIDPSLEWLVTNGLGGYASGPVCGGLTRRYHGMLIAALPAPVGRLMCVTALRTHVVLGDRVMVLDHEHLATLADREDGVLRSFTLEGGLPIWRYEFDGLILEKRVFMPHHRNATVVMFRVIEADRPVVIECQPWLQVRPHETGVSLADPSQSDIHVDARHAEIDPGEGLPRIRLYAHAPDPRFERVATTFADVDFIEEQARGYDHQGRIWTHGTITLPVDGHSDVGLTLIAGGRDPGPIDPPDRALALELDRRRAVLGLAGNPTDTFEAELVLAADQFLILPVGHDSVTAVPDHAEPPPGAASRTVIAGYHWFTDWGRDTMISLAGLTLETGRPGDAAQILRMFARHVQDGLIPNLFPEGARSGLYHTADATLWFVHAIDRYVAHTGDTGIVTDLLSVLTEIITAHRTGTRFGIGVDPSDGLLRQGAEGYQLTWMDAKVDGWVVTPRRGKAVEINALWYNALSVVARWFERAGRAGEARLCAEDAARARASFNRRFWNADAGYLYDVVDGEHGNDAACRPNQVFAIALPNPVLDREHWDPVLRVVGDRLLTPFGLRSLAPGHADYQSQYTGDLRSRDASYHQGTVWAWLIGPYIDALLKYRPDDRDALAVILEPLQQHLSMAGVGSISEIFDADMPHLPRGCIAQAWSVAEVLRAWKTIRGGSNHVDT